jgi:hypothetical protein
MPQLRSVYFQFNEVSSGTATGEPYPLMEPPKPAYEYLTHGEHGCKVPVI